MVISDGPMVLYAHLVHVDPIKTLPIDNAQHRVSDEPVPLLFGRNVQCQPVRGANTREDCHWSHMWQSFKRSKGVKLNGTPRQ